MHLSNTFVGKLKEIVIANIGARNGNCSHASEGVADADFALQLFREKPLVLRVVDSKPAAGPL